LKLSRKKIVKSACDRKERKKERKTVEKGAHADPLAKSNTNGARSEKVYRSENGYIDTAEKLNPFMTYEKRNDKQCLFVFSISKNVSV
jgi:hypothetical protein